MRSLPFHHLPVQLAYHKTAAAKCLETRREAV